jgi:regulator of protease activity HflC (stomatin/prohibitin superfamily)
MKQEMRAEADAVKAEADAAARKKRDDADARRAALITAAETKARTELGALQAEIASSYKSYANDPGSLDFAIFLRKSAALGEGFKSQTTWFLDPRTQPVDLLRVPDAHSLSPHPGAPQ